MLITDFSRSAVSDATQPVAILTVDVAARTAVGRTRQETLITINTSYHVGVAQVTPAVGEQWYITNYRGEWRLHSRIPFRTHDLLVSPTQGQTQIGSTGPTEIHGSVINLRSETFTINGAAYRDYGGALQRQNPDGSWGQATPIPTTVTSNQVSDSTPLGRLLMTAPDVNTVLSILGLAIASAGLDGGSSDSTLVLPDISGGTPTAPAFGIDLDGGTPQSPGDTYVTGGTP